MKTLIALFVVVPVLLLPSCATAGSVAASAQAYLEPYSFESVGQCDGQVAFNARYLAVNAKTTLTVRFRRGETVLWEKEFDRETGRHAYMVTFSNDGEFIEVVAVAWSQVRTSMTWLPGDTLP